MESFLRTLRKNIEGTVTTSAETRRRFSRDASIYELTPDIIVSPQNTSDVSELVKLVIKNKSKLPKLSITPRGAGTDITGGAIGESIIIDMTKGFNSVPKINGNTIRAESGVHLRDLLPVLSKKQLQLGCVPGSWRLSTVGGLVANNSGGEKSLTYGTADKSVTELTVVLSDGNPYVIKPLTKRQLDQKIKEGTYEAKLYEKVFNLIESNYDTIRNARPSTTKNSMGYNLWSVWDRDTGVFDPTKLFTGSQGTLGIITEATLQASPKPAYEATLVAYLPSSKDLGDIVTTVNSHKPASFEAFDDMTFALGVRHFKTFRRQLGTKEYLRQQTKLASSLVKIAGNTPNMVLTIGVEGSTEKSLLNKISALYGALKKHSLKVDIESGGSSSSHIKQLQQAPVYLVRSQIKGRNPSPFLDDMTVPPHLVSNFITDARKIIKKHKLPVTIKAHLGDGNLHITPLLDSEKSNNQSKLEAVMRDFIPVIQKYNGTMAGENNDGMIRGPWLPAIFGTEVYDLFRQTKEIFDPNYIFNPYKKTDASWEFSLSHTRQD